MTIGYMREMIAKKFGHIARRGRDRVACIQSPTMNSEAKVALTKRVL
jgi:hypothetical protein